MNKYQPLKIRDNTLALYGIIFIFSFLLSYLIAQLYVIKILALSLAFFGSTLLVIATMLLLKLLLRRNNRNSHNNKEFEITVSMPDRTAFTK